MAEKKGVGHAYNVDFLNVVFAASSLFLFLSVIWMVWDDYDRDWKNTQRRFAQLEYQVTQAQLQQAARAVDQNKLQQLAGAAAGGRRRTIAANQQKVDELQAKLEDVDNRLFRATHGLPVRRRRPTTRIATTSRRRANARRVERRRKGPEAWPTKSEQARAS